MTSLISSDIARLREHPLTIALASALVLAFGAPRVPLAANRSPMTASPISQALQSHPGALTSAGQGHFVPMRPDGGLVFVTNCNDTGPGSLRDAVDNAVDGELIDLTALTCSTITLTSGALLAKVDRMALRGPGADRLTIDGDDRSPVIVHYGHERLGLYALTVAHGRYEGDGNVGGCVTTESSLSLYQTVISGCTHAKDGGGIVLGGAIVAERLYALYSSITGSTVSSSTNRSYGGGAVVFRDAVIMGSTISDNVASGYHGNTGGIAAFGDAYIKASTISGNQAAFNAGLALFANYAIYDFRIIATTISGNVASGGVGGVGANRNAMIANSTIAFNSEGAGYSGGLFVGATSNVNLQSTIVSNNSSGGAPNDIGGAAGASLQGDNNLVLASSLTLPIGTLRADPELLPLADNGGSGWTHAIPLISPAIDAGSNFYGPEFYDQRGRGFARVVGGAIDIGAYEYQSTGVTRVVSGCGDSGAGTLRNAVDHAVSGDTIDMSGLACSSITLTSGALHALEGNLTLRGPGSERLAIDGNNASQVFVHDGAGTLSMSGVTITNGACTAANGCFSGGCIHSGGYLVLQSALVSSCTLSGDHSFAYGGGTYSVALRLDRSTVAGNHVDGDGVLAYGGGAWAFAANISESTLRDNVLAADGSGHADIGGGLLVAGSVSIDHSTVSGNTAESAGGVWVRAEDFSVAAVRFVDSTISENAGGGVVADAPVEIWNSTLSGNSVGAGLYVNQTARLLSSIVFGNSASSGDRLDILGGNIARIVGENDLIGVSALTLPAGTLSADPLLGPLQDNGGPTLTHALLAGSPAIDAGNNFGNITTDQRGSGYSRVFGNAADIGAFEVQAVDSIFQDGFD